jgi:hypothetical protein
MDTMKERTVICILDNDPQRCLREEQALDAAIADKGLDVSGIANYGPNYLARTGLERFPALEVEGQYFTPKVDGELDYALLCDFLDMLTRKGCISARNDRKEAADARQ